jgi:hypothetical protein
MTNSRAPLLVALLAATAVALGTPGLRAQETPAPEPPPAVSTPTATAPTGAVPPPTGEAGAAAMTTPPAAVPAEPEKQPKLVVAEPVRDLGRVRRGERLEVVYELENAGEAPLQIRSAQPSCGCTVASFDKQIEPGEKGELRAVIDTANLEGALAKGVTVISNDPAQPRLVLTLKLEVLAYVHVTPSFARLLQVQSMPPAATAVHLWTVDGPPLELGAIETGADWIVARARRAEPGERREEGPAEQWRVEVSLAPEAPLGPLTQSVVVATNHPRQPEVQIPLSGFVRPVLSTQPTAADFGTLGRGADPKQFVLKLFNFGAEPVQVSSAATDLAFVGVTVEPDEPGRRYRLRLALDPAAPKGKFEGTLRIATTSSILPHLEVPIRGRVQ